jgi:hypothetical protein
MASTLVAGAARGDSAASRAAVGLIRRLPDVDLIDTVQTESDAVARIRMPSPTCLS